jgi:phosphoesterase RecJ-like protein
VTNGQEHRQVTLAEAAEALLEARRIASVTHERSDGDGLAALALASVLKKLGKEVQVFLDLPAELAWVLPSDPGLAPASRLAADAFVVSADVANYPRIAWPEPERSRIRAVQSEYPTEHAVPLERYDAIRPVDLVIDHHATNRAFGLMNWLEPDRSAVAEMVLELVLELERRTGRTDLIDADVGLWLMVGLVTSTAWFQRDTGPYTWRAAELLDQRGRLDKEAIAERLQAESPGYFRLVGELRQATLLQEEVAHVYVDRVLLDRYQVTSSEAANFVETLLALPAAICLLFVEMEDGRIRVRLRSRSAPVHLLAQEFGGGGHERSSGTVLGSRDEASRLVAAAQRMVRAGRMA